MARESVTKVAAGRRPVHVEVVESVAEPEGALREPPAMSLEDREDQLIALAVNLAEERLRDGTASNQLIAEIMKLGTSKERLQKEKLMRENEVLRVKAEALEAQRHTDEMYAEAIRAMKTYAGFRSVEVEEDGE